MLAAPGEWRYFEDCAFCDVGLEETQLKFFLMVFEDLPNWITLSELMGLFAVLVNNINSSSVINEILDNGDAIMVDSEVKGSTMRG